MNEWDIMLKKLEEGEALTRSEQDRLFGVADPIDGPVAWEPYDPMDDF